jgi:hypothetical protein
MNTIQVGNWQVPDAREWAPSPGYALRDPSAIEQIIVHHSVTTYRGDDEAAIRQLHDIHLRNDWYGIAYHAVVLPTGAAYITGGAETVRYHSGGWNNLTGWAICLVGSYEHMDPPPAQVVAALRLVREVQYGMGRPLPVVGHRQVSATACPGNWWDTWGRGRFNAEEEAEESMTEEQKTTIERIASGLDIWSRKHGQRATATAQGDGQGEPWEFSDPFSLRAAEEMSSYAAQLRQLAET